MRYLSLDIEATGLAQDDYIIELAMIPFDAARFSIEESLRCHYYVKCPPLSELEHSLDPWVIKHNSALIEQAHREGITIDLLKKSLEEYLTSYDVRDYFGGGKIVLFGKSMNSIDLPFLKRDLGWNWMNNYFEHKYLDLSSVAYHLIDRGILPKECESGSELMRHLGMGDVCHTALEDARNTAGMYLKVLKSMTG